MKNEMMSSGKGKRKITLDPRTKLALLLMVATFVLGGAGGNELIWARILLAIIPAILLLFSGKVKAFFVFEMLFLAGCLLQYYLLMSFLIRLFFQIQLHLYRKRCNNH